MTRINQFISIFRWIFVGFDHHTPGYLIFIPYTRQKITTSLPVQKSTCIKKQNNKYDTHEWVSLAKEINEEEEPWEIYSDPILFISEPKGLCTILKSKQNDPTAFKLWSREISAELKNPVHL